MTNEEMRSPGVGPRAAQDVLADVFIVPEPEAFDYEEWRGEVEDAILRLAATGQVFDSSHVRDLGVPEAASPYHWGQVYSQLHTEGWLEPVGLTISSRKTMRGGAVRTWRGTKQARKAGGEAA